MSGLTHSLRRFGSKQSDLPSDQAVFAGDGAVDISLLGLKSTVVLSKASAAAITLAAPIAGDPAKAGGNDGMRITFISTTAQAHVVTSGTKGFNAKGSSGTATFATAKGNGFTVEAYNGDWYVIGNIGVTIA